jgi:hypothetical protein
MIIIIGSIVNILGRLSKGFVIVLCARENESMLTKRNEIDFDIKEVGNLMEIEVHKDVVKKAHSLE